MRYPVVGPKSGPRRAQPGPYRPQTSRWPQSSPSHRPITRRAFGAYLPDLWTVQYYLDGLGYDPGALDGLWGSRTQAAAQAFSDEWGTGMGTIDLGKAVAGSNAFGVALRRVAEDAGLDLDIVPPGSGAGGSGVRPEVQEVALEGETIVGRMPVVQASMLGGAVIPLALAGLGAVLLFGKKKGR